MLCHCCRYGQCQNRGFCGPVLMKEVKLKSGSRDSAIETRYCSVLQAAGGALAAQVKAGTIVGSECTNETEPHIVSMALSEEKVWSGPDDRSWMGTITAG
jgi:hypothetical protein